MTDQKTWIREQQIDPAYRDMIRLPDSPSDKPLLIGSLCSACERYFLGKRLVCPHCFSDSFQKAFLSNRGILYSFNLTKLGPIGFALPIAIGLVDLPERLRIWSPLVIDPDCPLKIGMEMELVVGAIRKDENGCDVLGFKFQSVKSIGRG